MLVNIGNVLTAGVRRFSALSKDIYVQTQNNLYYSGLLSGRNFHFHID